ncbi:MAG: enoyl-CoA hydratase/isomerase family protein [Actinobacteria bacterium]|nr:enoyl-CoA hydratase/isomerase family protein [Actinomycetota bacterium]
MVKFEVDDRGVATLSLNRPEVRNAFNAELIAGITDAVSSLPDDARVLVLRGEGKAFCAGADLEWMRSMAKYSSEDNIADSSQLEKMLSAIDSSPVPVVGRIHGAAIAGATGLVACCDYAVAEESTIFAFTETRLGLAPAVISPFVLRKVGYSFARAMFLTAERFDAKRAYEVGLVHRVVGEKELDDSIADVVESLLQAGPQALREARSLIDLVLGRDPKEVAELTVRTIARIRVSEEGQEGVGAFLEKRTPRWRQ